MKVVFFEVDNVLNFPGSEAKSPAGRMGVADSSVKKFKEVVDGKSARIVLTGPWTKEWNFDDGKCSADGTYLNKKLDRRGLHILDKTDDIYAWLSRHPNVTDYCILTDINSVEWKAMAYG